MSGKSVLAVGIFRNTLLHPMACACTGCMNGEDRLFGFLMFLDLHDDATFTGHGQDLLGISQVAGKIVRGDGDSLQVIFEKKYLEPNCADNKPIQYTFSSYEGWIEFQQLYHLRYLGLCGQYALASGTSDIVSLVLLDHLPDPFYFAGKAAQIIGLAESGSQAEQTNGFALLERLKEILDLKEKSVEQVSPQPIEQAQGQFDKAAAGQPGDVAE